MNWNPQNLFHCIDYDPLTWAIIILSIGVMEGYLEIAFRTWLPSMRASSPKTRTALKCMLFIFVFCGCAGYGTRALAGIMPKTAYISLVIFLLALNVLNRLFLRSKQGQQFRLIGAYEKIGEHLMSIPASQMANEELGRVTKELVAICLERQTAARKATSVF